MKLKDKKIYDKALAFLITHKESECPKIAYGEFTMGQLRSYIEGCQEIHSKIYKRNRQLTLPCLLLLLPIFITSCFHTDSSSYLLSVLYGLLLVLAYRFILHLRNNLMQTKQYNSMFEHYLDIMMNNITDN